MTEGYQWLYWNCIKVIIKKIQSCLILQKREEPLQRKSRDTLEKEDSFDVEYFNPKNLPAITLKLDELDLTSRLDVPRVQETFKKHLWSIPPSNTSDVTQLWYGLQWSSNSDSLFWNEYYSLIRLDENYLMTDFKLAAKVARDE